ncbi:hypothetical protein HZA42_01535 [Candidatus Peregrinibacteria bacterium]|nr:hypothetical protein [Candidatus Peregrinibacteria bacterium]
MECSGDFIDIRCPGADQDGDRAALYTDLLHDEGLNPPQTVTVEKGNISTPLNCTRFERERGRCRTFMPTTRIDKPLPPSGAELTKNYRFTVVRHVCNIREMIESALRDQKEKQRRAEIEKADDEALDL